MLFSIIVPIYNIEKYLTRCIESVLDQSFGDYELILVDDGSPDRCPVICDEYAEKDPRIKVIHKKNGGLVSARQAGIQIAQGDYIFNLDGDDAICPDALESARKIIENTHADMVCFSYRHSIDGKIGDVIEDLVDEGLYNREQIEAHLFPELLCDRNMRHIFYFSWGKAIRRDLVLKHQLQVDPAVCLGEDLCCMIPCYLEAETVYMSKKCIYLYTVRSDSLSWDFKTRQIKQIETAILYLRNITGKKPVDFEEQISRYSCYMCLAILATAAEGNHFKAVKELKSLILNTLNKEEIRKAQFDKVTIKSRITIFLMKRQWIYLAFYFLYFCKEIKRMGRRGKRESNT